MNALAPHTSNIFDAVTQLNCIKSYILVGGTALSLQIGNRQSEDLDFMRWRTSKSERMEVDWPNIQKELETIAPIERINLIDFDHVEYWLSGVKLSFYACPKYSPVKSPINLKNNLLIADLKAIGAMKMEVMLRRSTFRDYYDIYSLLRHGVNFDEMVQLALHYSGHILHTKNLYAILTNGSRFVADESFKHLHPIYDVMSEDIELYIRELLLKSK